MNLHKSKIEWCTHTWNPVTGCRNGCSYCYARRFIDRFAPHPCEWPDEQLSEAKGAAGCFVSEKPVKLLDESGKYIRSTPYPMGFLPTFHRYMMDYPRKRLIPSVVFVCSMADLFGDWVPDEWIAEVLEACKEAPQHVYLFLTKNPSRYMELARKGVLPEEPNFWYGSTITGPEDSFWWSDYHNTFVSMEPLLQPFEGVGAQAVKKVGWCIIGAMTGPGSKAHQPKREWVESIVADAKTAGVPVFMKDNLKGVWRDQLLRECPEGIDLADKKAVAEWDGE